MAISMPSMEKCAFRSLHNFLFDYLILYCELFVCVNDKFSVGIFICKNFFHPEGSLFFFH